MKEKTSIYSIYKEFISNRWYCSIMLLIGICTYGFVITHYAIGVDDTAISLYFDEGVAPYMGRWTLYLINKVIPLTKMSPFFMELVSMMIMLFSATTWCVLLKKICDGSVELPTWMYAIFGGLFISCPLISEIYVYYLHNGLCLAYGLVALALLALLEALRNDIIRQKRICVIFLSAMLLMVAMGCCESMLLVYIMAAIMIFVFQKIINSSTQNTSVVHWLVAGVVVLIISLTIRSAIIHFLNYINHFKDTFADLDSVQRIAVFSEMTRDEIVMNLKNYFIKYFINAITYFPIGMLLCCYAILTCIAAVFAIKKRDCWVVICTISIFVIPIIMCLVEENAIAYRAAQYVPVVMAFTAFLVAILIWRIRWKKYLFRGAYAVLLSALIWTQTAQMNQWFTADYMRYQHEKEILLQVAKDLHATCDVTKPIIFCGAVDMPIAVTETSEMSFSDSRYPYVHWMFDKFLPGMERLQYCPYGYGYHVRETIFHSAITWGIEAFDGKGTQVVQYMKLLGYSFEGEKDLQKIREVRKTALETHMPEYPKEGYIKECENYIIVNF